MSRTVKSDFWSGSVNTGSRKAEASPLSLVTTLGSRDSATLCQDLDPVKPVSSAAISVLSILDKNKPFALVLNNKSNNFDKETQQQQDTGGKGNSRKGNTLLYKQDIVVTSQLARGSVNALSDNEDKSVRSINRDQSLCLSQGRSSS